MKYQILKLKIECVLNRISTTKNAPFSLLKSAFISQSTKNIAISGVFFYKLYVIVWLTCTGCRQHQTGFPSSHSHSWVRGVFFCSQMYQFVILFNYYCIEFQYTHWHWIGGVVRFLLLLLFLFICINGYIDCIACVELCMNKLVQ